MLYLTGIVPYHQKDIDVHNCLSDTALHSSQRFQVPRSCPKLPRDLFSHKETPRTLRGRVELCKTYGRLQTVLRSYRRKLTYKRSLYPNGIDKLVPPVLAFWANFNIELPDKGRKDKSGLMIRQTTFVTKTQSAYSAADWYVGNAVKTHFLPIQFLGPYENGCRISLLSFANSPVSVSNQRSGMNSCGRAKLAG